MSIAFLEELPHFAYYIREEGSFAFKGIGSNVVLSGDDQETIEEDLPEESDGQPEEPLVERSGSLE